MHLKKRKEKNSVLYLASHKKIIAPPKKKMKEREMKGLGRLQVNKNTIKNHFADLIKMALFAGARKCFHILSHILQEDSNDMSTRALGLIKYSKLIKCDIKIVH